MSLYGVLGFGCLFNYTFVVQVMSYFRVAEATLDDLNILEKLKKTEVSTYCTLCIFFFIV